MKIAYLYFTLSMRRGAERILIDKMNFLSQTPGYEVYAITYEHTGYSAYPISDKVKQIDLNIRFYEQYRYGIIQRIWILIQKSRKFKKQFRKLITQIQPDILICLSYDFIDIKNVISLKDSSIKIVETHSAFKWIGKRHQNNFNFLKRFIATFIDRKLYKYIGQSDALVTLTQNDAEAWKHIKKAIVIPNMITNFPTEIDQTIKKNKRAICAGRLTEQKGFDLLIKAWVIVHQKHTDWAVDIYGEGEDYNALLHSIHNNKLDNCIILHPFTKQIYDKYMGSDFFILSSRWEGFGLVLIEAMSCGIPCVSFNCPDGPSEIIKDGENGLLATNGNIEHLAEKICYMIEHDDVRKQMGINARERVKEYLPEKIMPQWEALFHSLTDGIDF